MQNQVFSDLKIDDVMILDSAETRSPCPKCGRSRKYFCYTCFVAVGALQDKIPSVKLPFKVDIIKHPKERDGKSTACHAAVIAHDDVTIYTFPCIPEYDRNQVVLVFPGEDSVSLESLTEDQSASDTNSLSTEAIGPKENVNSDLNLISEDSGKDLKTSDTINHLSLCNNEDIQVSSINSTSLNADCRKRKHEESRADGQHKMEDESNKDEASKKTEDAGCIVKKVKTKPKPSFSRVVFIDSTWKQSKTIFEDERLSDLRRVELKHHKTKFWRSQDSRPDTYLSTIEALYYFLRHHHQLFANHQYTGQYDNLLFFFSYMCDKIKSPNPRGRFK